MVYTKDMLSQNDPLWKLKKINGTTSSIGSWGCLLTCVNDLLNKAGYDITPDVLAKQSELFDGDMWVGWTKLETLYPKMKYIWGEKCSVTPAPIDKIIKELDDGYFPIIMLDYAPSTNGIQTHYIEVIAHDDKNNLKVMDVIDGAEVWLDTRYGKLDEKYKILKVDVYHFEKPPVPTEEWDRIKSFLQESKAGEGKVREAFGALADKGLLEKQVKDLQDALNSKQQTLATKDQVISDLTNQLSAEAERAKSEDQFRTDLATMLNCTKDIPVILSSVKEAIGNEDKYQGALEENRQLLSSMVDRIKQEVEKKTFDVTLQNEKNKGEVDRLTKLVNDKDKELNLLKEKTDPNRKGFWDFLYKLFKV